LHISHIVRLRDAANQLNTFNAHLNIPSKNLFLHESIVSIAKRIPHVYKSIIIVLAIYNEVHMTVSSFLRGAAVAGEVTVKAVAGVAAGTSGAALLATDATAGGYEDCIGRGGRAWTGGPVVGAIRRVGSNIYATLPGGGATVSRRLPNGGEMVTTLLCARTAAGVEQISDAKAAALEEAKRGTGMTKRDPRRHEVPPR